jgi:hypothetical protein
LGVGWYVVDVNVMDRPEMCLRMDPASGPVLREEGVVWGKSDVISGLDWVIGSRSFKWYGLEGEAGGRVSGGCVDEYLCGLVGFWGKG